MKKGIADAISILLSIILISISLNLLAIVMMDRNALEYDRGRIYIKLYYEGNPLSLPDDEISIDGFNTLKEKLEKIRYSEYMIVNMQPLNWPETCGINKAFVNYNGREMEVKPEYCAAIQISKNVQKIYDFRTTKGRLFENNDFKWSGKPIPVLLGYKYNDNFRIGDVFRAEYLYSEYAFEVVGILESGSMICMSFGNVSLDEMIIMPSIEYCVEPSNEKEYVTQKINGSIQVSGVLVTDKNGVQWVAHSIDELLNETNIGKLSYYTSLYEYNFKHRGFISPTLGMLIIGTFGILLNIIGIKQLSKRAISLKRTLCLMLAVSLISISIYVAEYFVALETLGVFSFVSAGALVVIIINSAVICVIKKRNQNKNNIDSDISV